MLCNEIHSRILCTFAYRSKKACMYIGCRLDHGMDRRSMVGHSQVVLISDPFSPSHKMSIMGMGVGLGLAVACLL